MMTVTEYKERVQLKKSEMLAAADKTANSQKEIAFVTIGENPESFVQQAKDIFEEFGYTTHWYHYTNDIAKELDMATEISDLMDHYYKVFSFKNGKMCFSFAFCAYLVACKLVTEAGPQSICEFGNDDWLARPFVQWAMESGYKISSIPFGFEPVYSNIFEHDITLIFDPRVHINCYPIHKPIFKIFSWSTLNDENRPVYDMAEEIILKVVEERC